MYNYDRSLCTEVSIAPCLPQLNFSPGELEKHTLLSPLPPSPVLQATQSVLQSLSVLYLFFNSCLEALKDVVNYWAGTRQHCDTLKNLHAVPLTHVARYI